MAKSSQEIQQLIDRLRLIVRTMGWEIVFIDLLGEQITVQVQHSKE
mgnify:CR=1 FL=1